MESKRFLTSFPQLKFTDIDQFNAIKHKRMIRRKNKS